MLRMKNPFAASSNSKEEEILQGGEDLLELSGRVAFPNPRQSPSRLNDSLDQEQPDPLNHHEPLQVYHSELTPQDASLCDHLETTLETTFSNIFDDDDPSNAASSKMSQPFDVEERDNEHHHREEQEDEVASRPFDESTLGMAGEKDETAKAATSQAKNNQNNKLSFLGPFLSTRDDHVDDLLLEPTTIPTTTNEHQLLGLTPTVSLVTSPSELMRNTSPLTVPMSESMVMETLESIAGSTAGESSHCPQEIEIPIENHCDYLASVGQSRRLHADKYDDVIISPNTTNTTFPEDAMFHDEEVANINNGADKSRQQQQAIQTPPPLDTYHRRKYARRSICLATTLFVCGVGVGLLFIWKFGASNPFKKQSSASSSNNDQGDSFDILQWPSATPSFMPTGRPSQSPQPSNMPSRMVSEFPSIRPTQSVAPSISPAPTSSQFPSASPSQTHTPTRTYTPTPLPTSSSELPSMRPSHSPDEEEDSSSSVATLSPTATITTSDRICNGLASNCNKRANEIMYATVHNAMSTKEDGFAGYNHLHPIEEALVAGFRGFLIDSCQCGNDLGVQLCHSVCWAGTKDPVEVFSAMERFLRSEPNDILIVEIQVEDNSLWDLFQVIDDDFRKLMYQHPIPGNSVPWPTLNEMIDTGKRVIVFQHNGGNCSAPNNCPPGVHGMWTYGFETTWELNGRADFDDYDISCQLITGTAWTENSFMLNNHFVGNLFGLPSEDIAEEINTAQVLQNRMDACYARIGRRTNLLAVDFWSIGDTVGVVQFNNAHLDDDIFD